MTTRRLPRDALLKKPTQAVGRYTYETGLENGEVKVGDASMVSTQNAWEQTSAVASAPCLLISIEATIQPGVARPFWVLGYDAQPNDALVAAYFANTLQAARYSWGPEIPWDATSGALIIREAEELWAVSHCLPSGEWIDEEIRGFPFDRGIFLVLSSTPRVCTGFGIEQTMMSVTGRVQAR